MIALIILIGIVLIFVAAFTAYFSGLSTGYALGHDDAWEKVNGPTLPPLEEHPQSPIINNQ